MIEYHMDQEHMENIWKIMREHNLELVDDMSSEFKCIICKKILINACVSPCCCRFCVECIKIHLRDEKRKCPGQSQLCEDELLEFDTDIQINRPINKRILKLLVKCPNIGCQSQLELKIIEDHLRICENQPESCPYFILGCQEDKLGNNQMRDHISMEIHSHTKLLINWIKDSKNETKSIKSHVDKLEADNDKLKEDNDKMKEKLRSNDERTENIIQDLRKREREYSSEIEILNEEMCALKNSNRSEKEKMEILNDEHREQVSQVETKIKDQSQEIEHLKTAAQIQSQEIEKLKQECQQIETRFKEIREQKEKWKHEEIEQLETEVQIQRKEFERLKQRCQQTEMICEDIRNDSGDIQLKLDGILEANDTFQNETSNTLKSIESLKETINQINYDEIEWRIDNWSEKVREARSGIDKEIFSNQLFTHKNGYKICLSVIPDLDNYLAIYFYILRGPFDDILRWPFDRDLECSLMNQKTGYAYESDVRISSNFPNVAELQKPTSDRNECGFSFWFNINPDEMPGMSELCQEDQIFIRFTAKPAK